MKTNCWDCKNLQKEVYMMSEDGEPIYNCWCNIGSPFNDICDKFEEVE